MNGYTLEEKVQIAKRHLVPKQRSLHGLEDTEFDLTADTIDFMVSSYTREAGVRELDRLIAALCRHAAAQIAGSDGLGATEARQTVDLSQLHAILGPSKFESSEDVGRRLRTSGTAVGLAFTPVGGEILFVETEKMDGRGLLTLTGKLGEVMQESAKAALSWIRSHAVQLGLGSDWQVNQTDLHVHFPAGALPKDGPSAGVTIITALVSLLTGRPVRPDLAMTGEVTLRGLVLPVGGIKEKVIAAHRAGLCTVVVPARNEKELSELPPSILAAMSFILVNGVEDVLQAALLAPANLLHRAYDS